MKRLLDWLLFVATIGLMALAVWMYSIAAALTR